MTRYARFDPDWPTAPKPVLGWYDTELLEYPPESLPPETERVEITDDDFWQNRFMGHYAVEDGALIAAPPPVAPASKRTFVTKTDLLNALIAADRLRTWRAVLGLDSDTEVPDDRLALRERWLANDNFNVSEVPLIEALAAAGVDVEELLETLEATP